MRMTTDRRCADEGKILWVLSIHEDANSCQGHRQVTAYWWPNGGCAGQQPMTSINSFKTEEVFSTLRYINSKVDYEIADTHQILREVAPHLACQIKQPRVVHFLFQSAKQKAHCQHCNYLSNTFILCRHWCNNWSWWCSNPLCQPLTGGGGEEVISTLY